MGSNETTVNTGLLAGAVCIIAWWIVERMYGVEAPQTVVAASVTLSTALLQRFAPAKRRKKNDV